MASLRARVLASVLLLAAAGLVALAVVTYAEQRSFLLGRVDQEVRGAGPALSQALDGNGGNYALLLVPGVGPFAVMIADGRYNEGLMFVGGAQLLSLGIMALGAATPPKVTLVRDSFALRAAAPVALPGGGGLSLSGTF